MATFFGGNLAGATEMTDMLSSGLKASEEARQLEQRRKYEQAFRDNLDAAGNLNEQGFYQQGVQDGLNPDQLREVAKYHLEQTGNTLKNEQMRRQLQAAGVDPNAAGRNSAQYGDAQPTKISSPSMEGAGGAPSGPSGIDPDKLPDPASVGVPQTASSARQESPATRQGGTTMDQVWAWLNSGDKAQVEKGQEAVGMSGKDVDGKAGPKTAAAFFQAAHANGWKSWGDEAPQEAPGNTVEVTAQNSPSAAPEARMVPDTVGPDVFAPAQDRRSYLQRVEDSEAPLSSMLGQGSDAMPPPPDLTKADRSEVAGLAKVLRMQLGYRGNDVAGPDMQGAFNRLWQSEWGNVMAKRPVGWITDKDENPDFMKTIQAQQAWRGEVDAFPSTMAAKLQSLVKEGGVTIPGEKLAQRGTALGNQAKSNELARTTDSALGVDASVMDPAKLGEIRDRMGKWKTLADVAKHGGGEGAVGQEAYRATVEKLAQLAEGIAPTMEGSRLVQRISQQAGPWQSYFQEGKPMEGLKLYLLEQSKGSSADRKAALNEMLGTLRESIANDAQAYSARNGVMVGNNVRNALKFGFDGASNGKGPSPTGKVTKSGHPAFAF